MKIREGFVSNSSSTSFIIAAKYPNVTEEERKADYNRIMKMLYDPEMDEFYLNHTKPYREEIEELYNKGYYIGQLIVSNWIDEDALGRILDQLENAGVQIIYREEY